MHPTCDAPGCEEESRGRVSVFADEWTGGLYASFCMAHLFAIVNCWPLMMDGITGKTPPT